MKKALTKQEKIRVIQGVIFNVYADLIGLWEQDTQEIQRAIINVYNDLDRLWQDS